MPIIREMIITTTKGQRNMRRRWHKDAIIPCVVLLTIWNYGIEFCNEPPDKGMRLGSFLELIWQFYNSFSKSKIGGEALNLYIDTVKSELMPNWRKQVKAKRPHMKWSVATNK
jgi:hypothetical protein